MSLRHPVALTAALMLAVPATVNASADRYVNRLAAHAISGQVEDGCVVLRRVDLCGWRVKLITRTEMLGVDVADCNQWGRTCSYQLTGIARGEAFFCTGTVGRYRHRWIADQSLTCYGDRDPSWGVTEDGILFRQP